MQKKNRNFQNFKLVVPLKTQISCRRKHVSNSLITDTFVNLVVIDRTLRYVSIYFLRPETCIYIFFF